MSSSASRRRRRRSHRNLIKAKLYEVLAAVTCTSRPRVVRVRDGDLVAELHLLPRGSAAAAPVRFAGSFLSPLGLLVWNLLADGRPRKGSVIAAELGFKHDGKLKYLLADLVEREVLTNEEEGYARGGKAAVEARSA